MNNEIIESIVNNEGLTLAGEAAQQYVTYLYIVHFTEMGLCCFFVAVVTFFVSWRIKKNIDK